MANRRPKPLNEMSYEELQKGYHLVVGNPDSVAKQLRHIKDELGVGALLLEAQGGRLSHADTMKSIELFGKEVLPQLKD